MNPFQTDADNSVAENLSCDRRTGRRYEVTMKVRWKISRRRRVVEMGTGTTIDLSSSGVLFLSDQQIPSDGYVELSISWPVLLDGNLPMQLMATGRLIRVIGRQAAVRIHQHEFRILRASAGSTHH